MDINDKIRNAKYISEAELASLAKSHTVISEKDMGRLFNDMGAQIEKGLESALSDKEAAALADATNKIENSETVQVAGTDAIWFALPRTAKGDIDGVVSKQ